MHGYRCPDCPGKNAVFAKLQEMECFFEADVEFKQWQSTDRTSLNTLKLPTDEFVELVATKFDNLTAHSYIAISQAQYLKTRKESIDDQTAIVLGDFSENFSFVVQDEVQGYHWNKEQCTLHPVVVYTKSSDDLEIKTQCFCFISDDLNHDTGFVYAVQTILTKHLKERFPQVNFFEYFSDGCSGQYKNYKNFFNLTYHKQDFNLNASWNFFATSHGKSPCDGVGGMIKRKLTRSSLMRPVQDQILTIEAVHDFCRMEIEGVIFFLISKEVLQNTRDFLQSRYASANTVPGTRSFHHFATDGVGMLKFKRVSDDQSFCGEHNFLCASSDILLNTSDVPLMSYVSCIYDCRWWIGLVIEIDAKQNDLKINFLHPCGPSKFFHWPSREDACWVPISHLMFKISQPTLASAAAAMRSASIKYIILESEQKFIESSFETFKLKQCGV